MAWRRLAAALAGVAVLVLGAPLHQHAGTAHDGAPALAAAPSLDGAGHAGLDCPACHASGRVRALPAPAGRTALALAGPALRLAAPGAPAAPSAASQPPTPPRGPPFPTA